MDVHVTPETARNGYLEQVASLRKAPDSRGDDLKSGRVKPIDGEAVFENLRKREADPVNRPRR